MSIDHHQHRDYGEKAGEAAWVAVHHAVRGVATTLYGAGVEVDREIPGFSLSSTVRDVDPVAGVRAAVFTRHHAARLAREYAGWARGAGCRQRITDYGPFGHPDDNEAGHAPDCARHHAEVAAWHQQWEEDQP
ncbi:MAG: hypothetical protein ACRDT0_01525 [Pseudonocardiaceae bacterium]